MSEIPARPDYRAVSGWGGAYPRSEQVDRPTYLGTGAPEPRGLLSPESLRAVGRIVGEPEAAVVDVIELTPPSDHVDVAPAAGYRVATEALATRQRDGQELGHVVWS